MTQSAQTDLANRGALKLWITITTGPLFLSLFALTIHWIVGPMQSLLIHGTYLVIMIWGFLLTLLLALGGHRNGFRSSWVLAGLGAQTVSNIILFALFYSRVGLNGTGPFLDFSTGLYFSVVTWTTLGYGDLQPSDEYRLIAAFQALLGYVYMALFTGAAIARLLQPVSASDRAASGDISQP